MSDGALILYITILFFLAMVGIFVKKDNISKIIGGSSALCSIYLLSTLLESSLVLLYALVIVASIIVLLIGIEIKVKQ